MVLLIAMAGHFGGTKFWQIAQIKQFGGFYFGKQLVNELSLLLLSPHLLCFNSHFYHKYNTHCTEQDWKLLCFVNKPASHSTLFVMIVINSYCLNAMVVGIALL